MGNSIATSMVEKQKEVQQEMVKIQWANMLRGAERQRRMMLSTQIAVMRYDLMIFLLWRHICNVH